MDRRGNRPQFDVVTGVSTGGSWPSLPSSVQTMTTSSAIRIRAWTRRTSTGKAGGHRAFTDSLNDSEPLLRQIESTITPTVVARIAEGHENGRRLYIGTTDLDGRRPVVWDLGAIAASGKPDSRELICKLLLASAAIPAFFPSVEIPVEVDGKKYLEPCGRWPHAAPLFRPPYIPEDTSSLITSRIALRVG